MPNLLLSHEYNSFAKISSIEIPITLIPISDQLQVVWRVNMQCKEYSQSIRARTSEQHVFGMIQ